MKKLEKWVLYGCIFAGFLAYSVYKKWPDTSIQVIFCDVGQGDSILIQQDFFQVLVDSGRDDRVLGCLGKFLPVWDRTLEVVILTHGDEDHVGYFEEISGLYDMEILFFPDTDKDTATLRGVEGAISKEQENGTLRKKPILGQTIRLPFGGSLTFLEPPGGLPKGVSENDQSIVFVLEDGETRWLFTGDLEKAGETALVKSGVLPRADVLKVGHHGSNTSSSLDFLERVRPEWSIISAGAGNSYGHPATAVLENLRNAGSGILRTDRLGDIRIWKNGAGLHIETSRRGP